ncbi:MAG: RNA polymerase subunit sigma [Lachnospiraceae bacterium]|nr:RNA polymerase subunit sigma [Lachnospiraceae bacterium]
MSELTDGALRARDDLLYRNHFLQENTKFILTRAYAAIGHYVTESDDEWSIALLAFNDAIDRFNPEKGEFDGFASLVIRRRLYDYLRSEKHFSQEISLEPYAMDADDAKDTDEVNSLALEVQQKTVEQSVSGQDSGNIKDEIETVGEILRGYGFSFMDLADASPKAQKTKVSCAKVVAVILQDAAILGKLRSQKSLPIRDILAEINVPRKLLERHRRYIIAAAEILDGDFPLLAEYMDTIRKVMVS